MPRITNATYLIRRRYLQILWRDHQQLYSTLPIRQQSQLHEYYQTQSLEPDERLLAERTRLQTEKPSLPQQASKAYHRLVLHYNSELSAAGAGRQVPLPVRGTRRGDRRIRARPVARPARDFGALARALLALGIEQARKEREQDEKDSAA